MQSRHAKYIYVQSRHGNVCMYNKEDIEMCQCTIMTSTYIYFNPFKQSIANFSFNGKHYLQVEGTAIGSRLGMNYASTYLGVWKQQLLEQSPDKLHIFSVC